MLLEITSTTPPATDLGYLLHKNPARVQSFELAFGQAHVFYPAATNERCTAALMLDVDPIGLVRRRGGPAGEGFSLQQYVNDRPYVASSFMSVAIAQVFGTALGGRCKERPELAETALPLEACIAALPCRGGAQFLRELFEPLGYEVDAQGHVLDDKFADWGESRYFTVTLRGRVRLCDVLSHLYVLIPVLDNDKHYWVGDEEVEKLLRHGECWLPTHPKRGAIARRYLKHRHHLAREALARLAEEDQPDVDEEDEAKGLEESALEAAIAGIEERALERESLLVPDPAGVLSGESAATDGAPLPEAASRDVRDGAAADSVDRGPSLHALRLATVLAVLRGCGAKSVVDVGCGEGRLLRLLLEDMQPRVTETGGAAAGFRFERILGMDVSMRSLRIAADRLRLDRMPPSKRRRIELIHGSLMYRDARLAGFDAATCVEVIEHLDPPRLAAFERVLFEFSRPRTIVITTPNREYNVKWETLPAGNVRHRDHRFEWTRAEFGEWAERVATRFGYGVRFLPVGPEDVVVGAPTQMGVFVVKPA